MAVDPYIKMKRKELSKILIFYDDLKLKKNVGLMDICRTSECVLTLYPHICLYIAHII